MTFNPGTTCKFMEKKTGVRRLFRALINSKRGFAYLVNREEAFRQELAASLVLTPAAIAIGCSLIEVLYLVGVLIFVMVVEALNTAIEVTVDRIGSEYHELSGLAKDIGSASVLLAIVFAAVSWVAVISSHILP